MENIGARRLYTVIERIVEDISFNAPELAGQVRTGSTIPSFLWVHVALTSLWWGFSLVQRVVVDEKVVKKHVSDLVLKTDLSRFVL